MKQHFLKLFCLALIVSSMNATAQQTSLTIDNQTPGWLSSKINYGDQLSVERLKVTGYINGTDYKFLSQLIGNNLKSLDLEDVNIVEGGEPIHTLRMSTGELYYYYIRADLFPQWEEEYKAYSSNCRLFLSGRCSIAQIAG